MSWADRVAGADVSGSGVYFQDGVYPLLWIERCQMKTSRKGKELFIAEFKILRSDVEARQPGSEVSQVYNLSDHDAAPGNVKAFIGAAMNDETFANAKLEEMSAEEKREFVEAIEAVVSSDNPLHGRLVRAEASTIKTRSGSDFTLVKFQGIPDDIQAKAVELHNEVFAPF